MPKVFNMVIIRSEGLKELTTVSAKLTSDILKEHFGYNDGDINDLISINPTKYFIRVRGDKDGITTDYEWEKHYIPKYGTKIRVTLDDAYIKYVTDFLKNRRILFIEIEEYPGRPIGQVGFLGNRAVIIVSYYDEYDSNRDGKVSWGEWAASYSDLGGMLKNQQFTLVAMTAKVNPKVLSIDGGFPRKANNIFLSFAGGLMITGIYEVYLSKAVGSAASLIGGRLIGNSLKRKFLIEFGSGQAVQNALKRLYELPETKK